METKSLKLPLWRHLKRFWTVENKMKTVNVHSNGIWNCNEKSSICFYLIKVTLVGVSRENERWLLHSAAICYDISTCRENFGNKEAKWCILTLFETYTWRLIGTALAPGSLVLPPPHSIFIANLDIFSSLFFEMKCRLSPTGTIGATPVKSNGWVWG